MLFTSQTPLVFISKLNMSEHLVRHIYSVLWMVEFSIQLTDYQQIVK
jgi:hypothetical protein